MKKILWIEKFVPHYRVDLYNDLFEHYRDNGDQFILCSMKDPPKTGRSGIQGKINLNHIFYDNEYKIKLKNWISYWQIGLISIIKNINPDIVVFQGHVTNLTSWIAPKITKKTKFYSFQCGYEYRKSLLKDKFQYIYLRRFDKHLAYHTGAFKYLLSYHIQKEKIIILHNTINEKKLKKISRKTAREYLYKKYGVQANSKILLFVGVLLKEKNVELLIDIMSYLDNEYHLIIVGDGPHSGALKLLAKSINSNILFTGSILINKHYYFAGSDVFVLPGTGGLALNEALYYGLPILSGYADGSAEDLVVNAKNGFRIDHKSPKNIAELIEQIFFCNTLSNMQAYSKKLGKKYSFRIYKENIINSIC